MPYIGEFAALTTALCWVVTAMSFESAGRRVGSLAVNLLRLILAFFFLSGLGLVARGHLWPSDAGAHQWIWLPLSGLVGFTIGDLALFRAFVLIGSRLSTLIMSCVPLIAAVVGWFVMGERLTGMDVAGMALTLSGVALAVLERRKNTGGVFADASVKGVALGLVGAVGQAVGLVLSKYGMRDYDPFAATQIRVIAGIAGFSVLFTVIGWWAKAGEALRNESAMKRIGLGAFFGPFLGVSLSLLAVQHTKTGVAATLMSMTPVFILAPAAVLFKERITRTAVAGTVLAVAGVAVLVLT